MYPYRVRRDCRKCAVLCYTLGRWEFERSTRHCMEFKITKDKIARWNKLLLFWIKLRKYTHLAWFLLSIWPISSFLRGFQVFVAAFYRWNKAKEKRTECTFQTRFIQKPEVPKSTESSTWPARRGVQKGWWEKLSLTFRPLKRKQKEAFTENSTVQCFKWKSKQSYDQGFWIRQFR